MRYFKSTDGILTIFRATTGTGYAFGVFTTDDAAPGLPRPASRRGAMPVGLSNVSGPDRHPAVEITASEYQALQAHKVERVRAAGGDPARYTAPYDSWVRNRAIAEREEADAICARHNREGGPAGLRKLFPLGR